MRCSKQAENTDKWSNVDQSIVKPLPYLNMPNLEGNVDYFLKWSESAGYMSCKQRGQRT